MQIFFKIFSRLRIFYLDVCGEIIWLFVEISIGDLLFYGNPIFQRALFITSRYKKYCLCFLYARVSGITHE